MSPAPRTERYSGSPVLHRWPFIGARGDRVRLVRDRQEQWQAEPPAEPCTSARPGLTHWAAVRLSRPPHRAATSTRLVGAAASACPQPRLVSDPCQTFPTFR